MSAASSLSDVSPEERETISSHDRPNAALIHEIIRAEGESELRRTTGALALSGLGAGLAMGLSLVSEGLLQAHLPDAPWREIVSKLGYAVGFLIVILGRQQLFTENTLTPVLPALYHRDGRTLRNLARLWGVVLGANLVGTWLIAAVLGQTDLFPPDVQDAFLAIARHTIEHPFGPTTLRGVCAGWVIAMLVWLLPGAGEARAPVIVLMTWLVSFAGFAHVIAGSVDAAYLVLTGQAGGLDYLVGFFLPTLIGNILGGVTLVALLNFGQVATEIDA